MSRIVLLGISGRAGSRIAAELLSRGHQVTGIARDVGRVPERDGLALHAADATDTDALVPLLEGHDAVVASTRFDGGPTAPALVDATRRAGVPRLLVVGGAGSLEVAPGVALVDTPGFPEIYKTEAGAGRAFLQALRAVDHLDWTFLSPGALFEPGTRTGRFRTGGDALLVADDGTSAISMEDYAIALANEIEHPAHPRQRYTVAY